MATDTKRDEPTFVKRLCGHETRAECTQCEKCFACCQCQPDEVKVCGRHVVSFYNGDCDICAWQARAAQEPRPECKARRFAGGLPGGGDPPDCNFPFCDCFPIVEQALTHLTELGLLHEEPRPASGELREAWQTIETFVSDNMPPRPQHGSCGPEAGCDATCMDIASISESLRIIRKAAFAASERGQWVRLVEAGQEALVVIAALLYGTKWELSHTILSSLRQAHDKLLAALPAPPSGKDGE